MFLRNYRRYRHLAGRKKTYLFFLKLQGEPGLIHRSALNASDQARRIWAGLYEDYIINGDSAAAYERMKARAEADYEKWLAANEDADGNPPAPLPFRPSFKTSGQVAKSVKEAAAKYYRKNGLSVKEIKKQSGKPYEITFTDGVKNFANRADGAVYVIRKRLNNYSDEEE
jgi:pyruvate/2-oxoglutarate dehydrogenase complex dihydrolipoamide acyltransferase (E2) component